MQIVVKTLTGKTITLDKSYWNDWVIRRKVIEEEDEEGEGKELEEEG